MSEWDKSEWEKPYIDKYKIFVIDSERIVAVMSRKADADSSWAINAGIKEVAKDHIIKNITGIQEKTDSGSRTTGVILIIEPKMMGINE